MNNHLHLWKRPDFIVKVVETMTFFTFALIISHYAAYYATQNAGPTIPDVILDNIYLMDLSFIHYQVSSMIKYSTLLFVVFFPRYFLFTFKSMSILVLLRAFFVNLTNLGLPNGYLPMPNFFTMGGDLFFSGHVAIPFLLGLIFWDIKPMRYIAFGLSLMMAVEVLLGKFHYSIDVFAAPFFAFAVYHFAKYVFKKDFDFIYDERNN